MNCEIVKSLLMDYIYGELEEKQIAEVQAHLATCQSCREEVNTVEETRQIMQHLPAVEPSDRLVFMAEERRTLAQWWHDFVALLPRPLWARLGLAGVATVVGVLLVGALSNFELSYANKQLHVRMALIPARAVQISEQEKTALLEQVRSENAQMVNQMLSAEREEQQRQLNQTLISFARDVDKKRENDLQLIGIGMEELHQSASQRFQQTDKVLHQLIQNVSYPQK